MSEAVLEAQRKRGRSLFDLPPASIPVVAICAFLMLLFVLPAPIFPQDTLDGAWMLAAEQASRTGAIFGRNFVFTYGPFAVLTTGLFSSKTFAWVLLAGLATGLCWLGPVLASRRPHVIMLYALAIPVVTLGFDIRIVSALVAGCLMGMFRPSAWSVAAACGWGAIALSKLSFALVALPLMLLLDVHGMVTRRRLPLHTPALVGVFLAGLAASGIPPTLWREAATNDGSMIAAYSGSLQLVMHLGGAAAMLAMLAMLGAATLYFGWLIWSQRLVLKHDVIDTLFPMLAIGWSLWMSFKMGFVRADGHMVITWATLTMIVPAVVGACELRKPLTRWQRIVAPLLMVVTIAGTFGVDIKTMADQSVQPINTMKQRVADLAKRPTTALLWLTPWGWQNALLERASAEKLIQRRFPFPTRTTADVIPNRLSPVILSNLTYSGRPVPQSYSSYTPLLQGLDAQYFASHKAPKILFLDFNSEIDERLPTLSVGPSLPIIARWYDPIGTDELGAVLYRRKFPKVTRQKISSSQRISFGEWIKLPQASAATMTTAQISIDRLLLARLTGALAREPVLFIELRTIEGAVVQYRFVPGMAELGVVVSPMVRDPSRSPARPNRAIGLVMPGSRPDATVPITAIRLTGDPLATHAYSDMVLTFKTWSFSTSAASKF